MADVQPFRGVHYDWTRLDDPADVVAPPYDVIDDREQAALYARHPANVIRLILNDKPATGADNRYDDAARHFQDWLRDGTLVRDEAPGLYVYHQRFTLDGREITRRGFMGRVRLHPYEDRVILPHEQTLRGPKEDRLRLNETVGANLSQVFLLYDDPAQRADEALARDIASRRPDLELTTEDGITHLLWTVTDPAAIAAVQEVLADQALLIADGHHRYETNLALRDRAIEREGELADDDPRRFVLAYLANQADPGLLVLPTHRVVHDLADFDPQALLTALSASFQVETAEAELDALARAVEALTETHFAFGLVLRSGAGDLGYHLVTRERSAPTLLGDLPGPEALRELDLAVLHEVILKGILGMTEEDFSAKRYLGYHKGIASVAEALQDPASQATFLVNASPVDQVRRVCESGGKMPQKSTFFYPKVLSGLVFHELRR